MSASFAKCRCQYCNGNIEFERDRLQQSGDAGGQTIQCPHCGMETLIYVPPEHTADYVKALENPFKSFPSPGGEDQGEGERGTRAQLRQVRRAWIIVGILMVVVGTLVFFMARSPLVAQYAGGAAGLVLTLAIGVLILLWAILWIIFPVFVYFGMTRMERILRQIEINTGQTEINTRRQ